MHLALSPALSVVTDFIRDFIRNYDASTNLDDAKVPGIRPHAWCLSILTSLTIQFLRLGHFRIVGYLMSQGAHSPEIINEAQRTSLSWRKGPVVAARGWR